MNAQTRKRNLVWGGLLVIFGGASLVNAMIEITAWGWIAILAVAGMAGLVVYLSDRSWTGVLLVPYVTWSIAGFLALFEGDMLSDQQIATYPLIAVAIPFLAAYLLDRTKRKALIPAYVLAAVALMMVFIEGDVNETLLPAYILFAIAIPFLAAYVQDRRKRPALLTGGILAAIGLSFLIAEAAVKVVAPAILLLAGGWLLVRQFTHPERGGLPAGQEQPPSG